MSNRDSDLVEQDVFWRQVRLNVTSWLIICGVGGIGYIGYTVPRQLDLILRHQEAQREDIDALMQRQQQLDVRVTRIEERGR